jgi:hypothetical protein
MSAPKEIVTVFLFPQESQCFMRIRMQENIEIRGETKLFPEVTDIN